MLRKSVVTFAVALAMVSVGSPAFAGQDQDKDTVAYPMSKEINIIGGEQATEDYPWTGSLGFLNMNTCGASLIAPGWLVTARHCAMGNPDVMKYWVRLNSRDKTKGGEQINVTSYIKHDSYDIALMKLETRARTTPIKIADEAGPVGTETRILGWGQTRRNDDKSDVVMLKQLTTSIAANSKCNKDIEHPDVEICTDNPNGQGACMGDSGGPQVKKVNGRWELIGATSRGPGDCGTSGSVYMNVPALAGWIWEKTNHEAGRPQTDPKPTPTPTTSNPTTSNPKPTTSKPTSKPPVQKGELLNGKSQTFSVAQGKKENFFVQVPQGSKNLEIKLEGNNGDADLYVRFNQAPDYDQHDCRPWLSDSNESCSFASPKVGKYFVMVDGADAANNLKITATWSKS